MNIIENYGWTPPADCIDGEGLPARVTAVHRDLYELVCDKGAVLGKLKTAVYYEKQQEIIPTVGDFVLLQYQQSGYSVIQKTFPRRSAFCRRDPNSNIVKEQAVAANIDTCFILMSLNLDFNLQRLERYVSAAWQSGAVPVVLLTKSDLVEHCGAQIFAVQSVAIGVDVITVSTVSGDGIERINEFLKPKKTFVFLGSSGVGKSSLVNALTGKMLMEVKEIRETDSRGRHTTVHRQLLMLPSGSMLIDTPGMRGLHIWDGDGISGVFGDVEEILLRGCKFSDCEHKTEPGCAIQAALASGELSQKRWQNYSKLRNEALFVERKANAIRKKQEKDKSIAKFVKEIKRK